MTFVNNLSPILLDIGPLQVRWYGLFFALGIVLAYLVIRWAFKREKYSLEDLDSLVVYLFVGLVLGARIGHILFYNLKYFMANPIDIFKIWEGGLASHGAAIGLFLAYFLWCKVHKVKFSKYPDLIALGIPVTAAFVRIGNFFNSEIVGVKTNGNWGVIFSRLGDIAPRHPAQLYEAVLNVVIFFILIFLYKKSYKKTAPLFLLFLYIFLYFGGRFLTEFYKDLHVLPDSFPLSMGQVLSLIGVLLATGYFVFFFPKMRKK